MRKKYGKNNIYFLENLDERKKRCFCSKCNSCGFPHIHFHFLLSDVDETDNNNGFGFFEGIHDQDDDTIIYIFSYEWCNLEDGKTRKWKLCKFFPFHPFLFISDHFAVIADGWESFFLFFGRRKGIFMMRKILSFYAYYFVLLMIHEESFFIFG